MNFFEKRKLRTTLQHCNFRLAGEVIERKVGGRTSQNVLSEPLDAYLAEPCFENAVKLIDVDPSLTIYFIECNPEGFYTRQQTKKLSDTQEHQLFLEQTAATRERLPAQKELTPVPAQAVAENKDHQPGETRDFPNVIRTLRDSVLALKDQVQEYEQNADKLPAASSADRAARDRWLKMCREGVKEFETAIRILQSYKDNK